MTTTEKERWSDKDVRELPLPSGFTKKGEPQTSVVHYEGSVPGFGVRVTKAGARSYVLSYRVKDSGASRRYTIGATTIFSVGQARARAKELRREIAGDGDPMGDLKASRDAPSVADLSERYRVERMAKKRSAKDDGYLLSQWIEPELGHLKVFELKSKHVEALHAKITARTPIRANRVLSLVSRLLSLAVQWKYIKEKPKLEVERNEETERARYLSDDERARLKAALAAHPNRDAADAISLLLLTGCRAGELLKAQWRDIDMQRGIWRKPSATTKKKKEHVVPLSGAALALLAEVKRRAEAKTATSGVTGLEAARQARARASSPYVFRGPTGEKLNLRYAWAAVTRDAKLEDVHLHDLRHTFASLLTRSFPLHAISQILGHADAASTQRYAHLYEGTAREAAESVAAQYDAAKPATAEVVSLPERRPTSR